MIRRRSRRYWKRLEDLSRDPAREALVEQLVGLLLDDLPAYRAEAAALGDGPGMRRRLLRALMNLRPPAPLSAEYVGLQDQLLGAEREERGVVDALALDTASDGRIALWRGDITRLAADAIVNAANPELLGCFQPGHACVDNAIHSAAGLQLREACAGRMRTLGRPEPQGSVQVTNGYNLPSRYVFHTVGPTPQGNPTPRDGVTLAVRTAREHLRATAGDMRIVFDVHSDQDNAIYGTALQRPDGPPA